MLLEALNGARHVRRTSIGSLLADAGVLTRGDVVDALKEQRKNPETRLGDLLVASGKIQEDDLYRALGEQMGVPYVHLGDFDVDPEAIGLLPLDFARAHRVLPLMLHEGAWCRPRR